MSYYLKHRDANLIMFNITREIDGISTTILDVINENCNLLPLDLRLSEDGLAKWLKNRTIPSNRAYVQNFLAKLNLSERDIKGIIDFCKGLSLNDCFWVVDEQYTGTFSNNNLYDNPFSRTLSYLAFTGYGSRIRSTLRSSPEFTTNGMLAKCWRRISGEIYLFKTGTEGFVNSGKEPYSEFYAYQIAAAMGLEAVPYSLSKWHGKLCSTCKLFTSKELAYIPIGNIVTEGGIKAVMEYYKNLGDNYYQQLINMFVFDAVICNTDRHFGNFGFLVDSNTNRIIAPAPIFDNGLSLLCYSMDTDINDFKRYAQTLQPAVYNDFVIFAKQYMGMQQKHILRKLIGFRFKKHSRYNLDEKRLMMLEKLVAERVNILLKE